jgi:putative transposase
VRSEQSLATDEACRDKGSGRVPEPAGTQRRGQYRVAQQLQRQFNPDAPDERWVTDITYIRTHEGWLYLAVVVDLFSRKIIGWSMQSRMTKDIVLNALLMAVWRRNPQTKVLVHSDQGSQYTSHEWQSFLKSHGLEGV